MPSMVSTARPSASAPSTRQAHTRRPSSITLQAPQSPERAAFLAAGELELVAQHVEQGLLGLAQELDRVAVDGGR